MKIIDGGITSPKGFKSTGFYAGIRKKKNDMALIYSEVKAKAVGVFTKNTVKAAPVIWDQEVLNKKGNIQAIVVNSGNANACTGESGKEHAKIMAETTAECLNLKTEEVLVSSTGVIGVPLPIDIIEKGIKENYDKLGNAKNDSDLAAEAIMTTDTFPKKIAIELEIDNKIITIAGIAKGSGMIHPNMGTMLGYITTDVNISRELLDKALKTSTLDSYNMISVDGDTSTNDTVIVMANGMAENTEIMIENEDYKKFKEALHFVNTNLSKQIVKDGEGAGKFLAVSVDGAKTKEDARVLTKSVINSSLVKTAFFGEDANWGRIVCAMGYTGIEFDLNKTSINFTSDGKRIDLMENGVPLEFSEEQAKEVLKASEIEVNITLGEGSETATAWGCDLSYDYVKINADYRT
ncbi:arginine biosynthesis bifunctional protein ArgJ [Gottschalkia acidurici 9a]|uniref:Arginine biosynthesis bifunctional protein ArgJ n=1 Tax=Gottschalkia acidurici (strain ATCC 7906 / DSM 604 / BCRC 14475 / CIP 104303 / KCTC 5404 / NCIMB 10678 / 9a) TaxID=1128398 RepID=K0B001_GOTA9|nr:bifunctional ornithine acetyltransferase/N-acetylglutamate synthase [Gottschalkia acidurici]AFS78859.1 arginine biosynthesis bifunctional protein ArgJ [Gottschalkia acidurici 9a]